MIYVLLGVNLLLATVVIMLALAKLARPQRAPAKARAALHLPSVGEDS